MQRMFRRLAVVLALAPLPGLVATPTRADSLIGSYIAFIGQDDLFNSQGKRLTAPWQVLRQDRANFHRFGVSQPGDEWDPYFGVAANRATLERMVRNGRIEAWAGKALLRGGVMVEVRIYGTGKVGRRVEVDVVR